MHTTWGELYTVWSADQQLHSSGGWGVGFRRGQKQSQCTMQQEEWPALVYVVHASHQSDGTHALSHQATKQYHRCVLLQHVLLNLPGQATSSSSPWFEYEGLALNW